MLFWWIASALGAAIYEQLPSHEYTIDSDPRSPEPWSSLIAEDFELNENTAIGKIQWWGVHDSRLGQFELAIYADSAGRPGTLLSQLAISSLEEFPTGRPIVNQQEYRYEATLQLPFVAQAGVHYWLSIGNPTVIPGDWNWESGSGSAFPGVWRRDPAGDWNMYRPDLNMAFAVPEPSPLHLGITFLVVAGLVRRVLKTR